jgi:hypothetical protein
MPTYLKVSNRLRRQLTNAVAGAWLELKQERCPETFTDLPPEAWSPETKATMELLDAFSNRACRRIETALIR